MNIVDSNLRFCIFPYLKTSDTMNYHGILFRSVDNFKNVPDVIIDHIKMINDLFYLQDGMRIKKMVYTYWEDHGDGEKDVDIFRKLSEFQSIITYYYSSPHKTSGRPFLSLEHTSFFVFKPKRFTKFLLYKDHNVEYNKEQYSFINDDEIQEVDGYEVILNNKIYQWKKEGIHIYPPTTGLWLNISQDLYRDLKSLLAVSDYATIYKHFNSKTERNDLDRRILKSLLWYNRSITKDVDEELAIIYLAVAFESLLSLKQGEKLSERFKDSINLLLGNIPRLDSWLNQFYEARSQILHEGWTNKLKFLAIDTPFKKTRNDATTYRSLTSYGRNIFRICVNTILTGSFIADEMGIPSMLVTNQERFENICKLLDQNTIPPYEKIISIRQLVLEIRNYQFEEESGLTIRTQLRAVQRLLATYHEMAPTETSNLLDLMIEFTSVRFDDDYYQALSLLKRILKVFSRLPEVDSSPSSEASIVVLTLLESVWNDTFMYFSTLQKREIQ